LAVVRVDTLRTERVGLDRGKLGQILGWVMLERNWVGYTAILGQINVINYGLMIRLSLLEVEFSSL